jgi:hypothetical protein
MVRDDVDAMAETDGVVVDVHAHAHAAKVPPPMATGRRMLNAYLTEEAHDGWHEFAREHGVTVSALLEVLGRRLRAGELPDRSSMVAEARGIDAQRRSRRRD